MTLYPGQRIGKTVTADTDNVQTQGNIRLIRLAAGHPRGDSGRQGFESSMGRLKCSLVTIDVKGGSTDLV